MNCIVPGLEITDLLPRYRIEIKTFMFLRQKAVFGPKNWHKNAFQTYYKKRENLLAKAMAPVVE